MFHRRFCHRLLAVTSLQLSLLVLVPGLTLAQTKEPKKRVAVTAFENKRNYAGYEWGDIGQGLAEKLVDALIETGKFVVLERLDLRDVLGEHKLGEVAPIAPEIKARLTSAQALIRGVVTNIDVVDKKGGKVRLGKLRLGGGAKIAIVKVNIRIIDTVTGQVIESATVAGEAKIKTARVRIESKKVGTDVSQEKRLPIGEAADEAIAQAVQNIVNGMDQMPWQGNVSRVSGEQIFINAGSQENVEPGLRLRVFERGAEMIDPETNESLGSLDEEIGVIEIEKVGPRFSVAKIVAGGGFARGNIVRPTSTNGQMSL